MMIRHFRGSNAIGMWSHFMFGLERNQQAEDPEERQLTTFRILKDRNTGQATGKTLTLGYDPEAGRLYVRPPLGDPSAGRPDPAVAANGEPRRVRRRARLARLPQPASGGHGRPDTRVLSLRGAARGGPWG